MEGAAASVCFRVHCFRVATIQAKNRKKAMKLNSSSIARGYCMWCSLHCICYFIQSVDVDLTHKIFGILTEDMLTNMDELENKSDGLFCKCLKQTICH